MEHACLKTIAAFLNTRGGYLIIGVNNKGEVLGIDNDQFQNEDNMNLHLVNLIRDRIGAKHFGLVELYFDSIAAKQVLVVKCKQSEYPIFVRDEKDEQFYIRTGSATNILKPSDTQTYIKQKF